MPKLFVEQPLAVPGSASNYCSKKSWLRLLLFLLLAGLNIKAHFSLVPTDIMTNHGGHSVPPGE